MCAFAGVLHCWGAPAGLNGKGGVDALLAAEGGIDQLVANGGAMSFCATSVASPGDPLCFGWDTFGFDDFINNRASRAGIYGDIDAIGGAGDIIPSGDSAYCTLGRTARELYCWGGRAAPVTAGTATAIAALGPVAYIAPGVLGMGAITY